MLKLCVWGAFVSWLLPEGPCSDLQRFALKDVGPGMGAKVPGHQKSGV